MHRKLVENQDSGTYDSPRYSMVYGVRTRGKCIRAVHYWFVTLHLQIPNSRGQMDVQQKYASLHAGKLIYWVKMSKYVVPSKVGVISLIS